jgi:predicted nucleic acid-binding protein
VNAAVLCDTNVVVKWFHDEPDEETTAARRIAEASAAGLVALEILDLTYYEVGNVLRRIGRSGPVIADVLEQLHEVCGPGIVTGRHGWAAVAGIADREGLSFYDAAYVAAAEQHRLTLLTADRAMIKAGGVLPSDFLQTLEAP